MSQAVLQANRCVKCGQDKLNEDFRFVCVSCSSFKADKFIKAFCFKCHRPIYERTPHVIGMTEEFSEFVCRTCFNSGKYKPRGELNYYKCCKSCKEYFYSYENQQKFCTPQCYLSEKKPAVTSSQLSSKSFGSKTHAPEKNEVLSPEIPSFSSQRQSKASTSGSNQTRLDPFLTVKTMEGSSK